MGKIMKAYTDPDIGATLHTNPYYLVTTSGGYNKCLPRSHWGAPSNTTYQNGKDKYGNDRNMASYYKGCVLPNCTGYAYGRFMECQGITKCRLSTGDAGKPWYNHSDGYKRGQVPKLGAVACWTGHVGIVEQIHDNGNVTFSMSNHGYLYFQIATGDPHTLYKKNGKQFFGYIYPDTEFEGSDGSAGSSGVTMTKYNLNNMAFKKGYYSNRPADAQQNNATIIYIYLHNQGWSDNAIFAILGNMDQESGLDPSAKYGSALGLVQWTPGSKWTRWADSKDYKHDDGYGQLDCILQTHSQQWAHNSPYNLDWDEFTHDATHSIEYLTRAFEREYERSADNEERIQRRISYANKWANWLTDNIINKENPNYPYTMYEVIGSSSGRYGGGSNGGVFTGDFEYTKPNNKHLLLTGGWI